MPQTTSLLHLRIGLLLQAAGSLLGLVKEGSDAAVTVQSRAPHWQRSTAQ